MGEFSGISWTHHTFNPWWGCTRIDPACEFCYAEEFAHRYGTEWGVSAPRRIFGEKHWREPVKWDRKAQKAARVDRVFCASMADLWDKDRPAGEIEKLWSLIGATPNLDWLLLTKRPGSMMRELQALHGDMPRPNIWAGMSAGSQETFEKWWGFLRDTPAVLRWISWEPALGPLTLKNVPREEAARLGWVIGGGESGAKARPSELDWFRSMRDECAELGIPFFMKQVGGPLAKKMKLVSWKGDNPDEWPSDLRVQQFPEVRRAA